MLGLVRYLFVISTSVIDCLGRFVPEMTYYVSSGTVNLTKLKPRFSAAVARLWRTLVSKWGEISDICVLVSVPVWEIWTRGHSICCAATRCLNTWCRAEILNGSIFIVGQIYRTKLLERELRPFCTLSIALVSREEDREGKVRWKIRRRTKEKKKE